MSKEQTVVLNTFGWHRLEVVRLTDVEEEEPNKAKRAKLEHHCEAQVLHDGCKVGMHSHDSEVYSVHV